MVSYDCYFLVDSGDFETRPENVDLNTAPPPPDVDKSSN